MKSSAAVTTASAALLWLCCHQVAAGQVSVHDPDMPAMDSIPGTSLYQLPVILETSDGATIKLSDLRGQPLVVTMFYSHCADVCPLLTAQLQRLESQLSPAGRKRIRILMVSFDSVRDTPEVLAAALGIRYRELSDRTFNHSALISVADRAGTVRARSSDLTGPDRAFTRAVQAQIDRR